MPLLFKLLLHWLQILTRIVIPSLTVFAVIPVCSSSCQKKLDIGKPSIVQGRVYIYGTNEPLSNHTIRLYGSYGSMGDLFDYQLGETTTDNNGFYSLEYEVVDGVIPRITWLPSSDTESFNETHAWTNPNFQQYNSCYMQGPPPNTDVYTIAYHQTTHHDVALYPYAKLEIKAHNENFYDALDKIEIKVGSDLQNIGANGIYYPYEFTRYGQDSTAIVHWIFNKSYLQYVVTRNGIASSVVYDTLSFNMCDEIHYEIHY